MRKLKRLIGSLLTPKPISGAGLTFITRHEGFVPTPYPDPAGYATVGTGHLIRYGPVKDSDRHSVWVKNQRQPGRLTPAEGQRLLRKDISKDLDGVVLGLFRKGGPLHGKFRQHRADALYSFAYNLGPGSLQGVSGFETMGRAIDSGDLGAIADAMLLYDKAGGQALAGLTRRRQEERRLFLRGRYH